MKGSRLMPAWTPVVLLILLVAGPALAQDPPPPTQEETRDQGILYFKRDVYGPAMAQLTKAWKMKGGNQDFETAYYRGRSAQALLLLEVAFEMADASVQLAGEDKRQQKLSASFKEELDNLYASVLIEPAAEETNKQGRIFLESKTGIINKDKKKVFLSIRERFRTTNSKLPTRIYLPFGDYLANNVPFSIKKGVPPPSVKVFLQIQDKEEGLNVWWISGIAGAAAVTAGVVGFFLFTDDTRTEDRAILGITQ